MYQCPTYLRRYIYSCTLSRRRCMSILLHLSTTLSWLTYEYSGSALAPTSSSVPNISIRTTGRLRMPHSSISKLGRMILASPSCTSKCTSFRHPLPAASLPVALVRICHHHPAFSICVQCLWSHPVCDMRMCQITLRSHPICDMWMYYITL